MQRLPHGIFFDLSQRPDLSLLPVTAYLIIAPMKLLLATLHSRYSHSSLALPCIAASCAKITGLETVIREHTVNERPEKVLVSLAAENADIIAFSCYIWNVEQTLKLAAELKLVQPDSYLILGGPEVSYGSHELMAANPHIDAVIHGEGEETFRKLMQLLTAASGRAVPDEMIAEAGSISFRSGDEIITAAGSASIKELDSIPSPFAAALADTSKPLVYSETSRGCPFSCAFCLSSVEKGVRSFSMPRIESDLYILMRQGVETVKLVDRTFNYDPVRADHIWKFILANNLKSRFHFEIAADLLTDDNISLLKAVPADMFRFEIGVQSTAPQTLARVDRSSDLKRVFANVRRLQEETAVTIHLDLVAGLPGENFEGFEASLDRLLALKPHHIQVEPLKMLKGTAMRKSAGENGYCFSPYPPYRILKNSWLSFADIWRIEECSQALDIIYNSGRFAVTLEMISRHGSLVRLFTAEKNPAEAPGSGGNQLAATFESIFKLTARLFPELIETTRETLRFDYCMTGHPGGSLPLFLKEADKEIGGSSPPLPYPEIAASLSLPARSRFRTFTAFFGRDYTNSGWTESRTKITFVYCSLEGRQKVLLLADGSCSG